MEAVSITTTISGAPLYLGDLEKCGIATSNNLREILTTCADPVEAIKQFQVANSVQVCVFCFIFWVKMMVGRLEGEYWYLF
ncbi:unnamed protein product [Meloidogyne enterolobii]|uniref:Uncharacterized protein n=1 Tax=Meloidogyne enterolobii TaxID=390850 RepID=A0ACB0XYZ3_MELEN